MTSTGYGNPAHRLYFDGDENKYEMWEIKMLSYMKLKKLKNIIQPGETIASADKREEAFAELVQFLDDRSLNLVMRDAKDDGRKALEILRDHYAGRGKQRVVSLYTTLTSLIKQQQETLTDYIIRAETAAASLKAAGELVSDGLLITMVLKGLPQTYKPFTVVITQAEKVMTFQNFKASIRNFEENEKATTSSTNDLSNKLSNVMRMNDGRNDGSRNDGPHIPGGGYRRYGQQHNSKINGGGGAKSIVCYSCGEAGHKSNDCSKRQTKKKWCSTCKNNTHNDRNCRKKDIANQVSVKDKENIQAAHTFCFGAFDDESQINSDTCIEWKKISYTNHW